MQISLQIPHNKLTEFIALYRDEFGEELTIPEARLMAQDLLNLYDLLMQPLPGEAPPPPTPS